MPLPRPGAAAWGSPDVCRRRHAGTSPMMITNAVRVAGVDPPSDLYLREGPFATVYLPTPSEVEDAAERLRKALESARSDLEQRGACPLQLNALRESARSMTTAGWRHARSVCRR
ncbi:MAG: hypothetical protein U5R31_06045 [Acidimicrobiia bacterium]|nr:hypothetical protein [Acidimicrobiia bacterium]